MLAVVKTPHTENTAFTLVGNIDKATIEFLNNHFGKENVIIDKEIINIIETDWFKCISETITPGSTVRIYRENLDLTQEQLAQKAGIQRSSYISDIENGRRPVSKKLAKKFAEIFGVSVEMFI